MLKKFYLFVAIALSFNSYAAGTDPGPVTIVLDDGSKYRVYVEQGTFNNLSSEIQSSPLWGSSFQFAKKFLQEYNTVSNSYSPNNVFLFSFDGVDYYRDESPYAGYAFWPKNEPPQGLAVWYSYLQDGTDFQFAGRETAEFGSSSIFYWLLSYRIPFATDTLASMHPNASAMKNAFNSQYATLAYGLNHDCTLYDSNGICVSVFGRNTSLNDSAFDNNAAGLVLGYKPHAQFRIGTYIDQSLDGNTTGGVKVERSNPDVGVFGVWNMNADGSGLELRAAANYGKRDLNVTRTVVGTAEAGSGRSDLNAYGALLEASFSHTLNDSWIAKPYAGVRYLAIKRDGYTEASTDNVYNPLTYSNLEQETTSAIAGVRLNGRLAPKLVASLNAGLEYDLRYSIDDYRATSTYITEIGSIDMNSQNDRTRPTAGLGIAYDIADKQRLSANVQYRKEIFMSESSTTGQVTYTIGF